jgi:hypothetical protein
MKLHRRGWLRGVAGAVGALFGFGAAKAQAAKKPDLSWLNETTGSYVYDPPCVIRPIDMQLEIRSGVCGDTCGYFGEHGSVRCTCPQCGRGIGVLLSYPRELFRFRSAAVDALLRHEVVGSILARVKDDKSKGSPNLCPHCEAQYDRLVCPYASTSGEFLKHVFPADFTAWRLSSVGPSLRMGTWPGTTVRWIGESPQSWDRIEYVDDEERLVGMNV